MKGSTTRWRLFITLFILLWALALPQVRAVKRAPSKTIKSSPSAPSKPKSKSKAPKGSSCKASSSPSSRPTSPPPPEPSSSPAAPPSRGPPLRGGDLTVNIRLKDGSLYPLPVNITAGMLGLRQQLLSAGLVGHAAEPLRLQRFQDGARMSVPLNSTSELRGGDLIIIESSLSSSVPSTTRRWRPTEADFVPYPDLQWKGKVVSGRAGRSRTRTFGDINLYKVTPQVNASVSLLKLDSLSIKSFIDRLSETPESMDSSRVALLYGRVNTTSRQVRADALFEPSQQAERTRAQPYDDASLVGQEAARATKVAGMLGMVPVGWIVGNGGRGSGGGQLSAQDVIVGAKLQLEAMKRDGKELGGSFVMVMVNVTKGKDTSVEAYQVSKQAVQMLSDGLLDPALDRARLQRDRVPVTSEVFINNEGAMEVDTAFFTVPVGIATHRGPLRHASGPLTSNKDLRALISDEGRIDSRRLPSLLSDFHVLLLLNRYLKNEELEKVCRGLYKGGPRCSSSSSGKGKGGKKRGAGSSSSSSRGGAVPQAIAALVPLLEALCDEE